MQCNMAKTLEDYLLFEILHNSINSAFYFYPLIFSHALEQDIIKMIQEL